MSVCVCEGQYFLNDTVTSVCMNVVDEMLICIMTVGDMFVCT